MSMKDCERIQELLSAYADGQPTHGVEAGAVEKHLQECGDCRRFLETLRVLDGESRRVTLPAEAAWDEVWAKIRSREAEYEAGAAAAFLRRFSAAAWRPTAWVAAAAAILLAVYMLGPWTGGVFRKAPPKYGFEVVRIEVASPGYTAMVMVAEKGQIPVVWLERT